jgi:ribosomal protein L16 Arg81 hydroxylase
MISDLQSLVDPLTQAEFLTLLRERKLIFLPGSGSPRFETLLNWEALNHLLDGATFPLEHLRVVRESTNIPSNLYINQDRVVPAALSNLLVQGVSLIFNQLDKHVSALRVLCKNIARDTSERITAGAIVTSGRGGALEWHYDPEDLIILQIAGTKRWQVFGPTVVNPLQGAAAAHPPQGLSVFDQVLQPGDFLFLPAGHWHHCENGPDRSLHVGIFFEPPAGRHLLSPLVSHLLSDEIFRCPLTRHGSPDAVVAHESELKAHLIDAIQSISLARFLEERAALRFVDGVRLEGRSG